MAEKYISQYTGLKIDEAIGLAFLLDSLKGVANGLATLDKNGNLVQTNNLVKSINGQSGEISNVAILEENGKLSKDKIPDANIMGVLNLGVAEEILENSDLNNYINEGTYRSSNKVISQTLLNSPRDDGGFKLLVSHNQTKNWITQIAIASSFIWIRNRTDVGVWSSWIKIAGNPTELWAGSWSGGTITIPNINNYSVFKITLSGMGTAILAFRHANFIRGMGGYSSATSTIIYYQMAATVSDTTLTFVASNSWSPTKGGTTPTEDNIPITSIIGLI